MTTKPSESRWAVLQRALRERQVALGIAAGAGVLAIIIGVLIGWRFRPPRESRDAKRQRIIRDLASPDKRIMQRGMRQARKAGLFNDKSLEKANLVGAQWNGIKLPGAAMPSARLVDADLGGAQFVGALLTDANLWMADLTDANLAYSNLTGAQMMNAKLRNARLVCADLQSANLWMANLRGADLTSANLKNAQLTEAHFDEQTILPDGTRWSRPLDLRRYTDPTHAQFWRSGDVKSPAYGVIEIDDH